MNVRIFDSLSLDKKPLGFAGRKKLRLFVCGPTVYDFLHIGNARTYLIFDAFVKYLRSQGVEVFYLQNITDVDDKIIGRAQKEGVGWREVAGRYKKIYLANMKALGVTAVNTYAPASKFIPQITRQIQTLIRQGHVYEIKDDGYYFDATTFPDYGKLSRRTVAQAEDGVTRIDENIRKRNKADFCVWKFSKSGEPSWKTELGSGRPGWHIEDTAITEYYFGPQYEIHGAGVDLKFPHHEAEIAQQESVSGKKPFVKIWMHVGALTVNGKKMSKSLGNFITIGDFLRDYEPETLRLLSFTTHYRSPLNFTRASAEAQEESWNNIGRFFGKLAFTRKFSKSSSVYDFRKEIRLAAKNFEKALADDFNTPEALATLFELMGKIQPHIFELSAQDTEYIRQFLKESLKTLGFTAPQLPAIPLSIKKLAQKRETHRSSKQFVQADRLRKKIDALGYVIDDTTLGPFLWPKHKA